jgi:hypothetical protein
MAVERLGHDAEQVTAAAPDRIGPYHDAKLDTPSLITQLVTTHHAQGFNFSVAMLFDRKSQGLGQVRLLLNDPGGLDCAALSGSLRGVYGPPETIAAMGFRRWRDVAHGNLITIEPLGGCWLVYEPIPTSETSRL